jgi:hypothetical protein
MVVSASYNQFRLVDLLGLNGFFLVWLKEKPSGEGFPSTMYHVYAIQEE